MGQRFDASLFHESVSDIDDRLVKIWKLSMNRLIKSVLYGKWNSEKTACPTEEKSA